MASREENVTTTPEPETIEVQAVQPSPDGFRPHRGARRQTSILVAAAALAALALMIYSGIHSRAAAESRLTKRTEEAAIPTVAVVFPREGAPTQEIVLPGNTQAFSDAPIYARTSGYLKRWYFDIGAHVKTGQLLAEIESPEVDQQLQQARADLATAQANYDLAAITATRYEDLLKTDAVAKQDVDNAEGNSKAKKAMVDSAQYNVNRLEQMQSFEKIYAPFEGVITARNTDIGDLIDSGNSGGVKTDLFHIAQPGVLRVYINVPEEYSQGIKTGMTADLALAEFPGRKFQGKLIRTAEAINMTTRTLLIEVDVDNPTGTLLTGSYAEVHLKVPTQASTYLLPVNTLIFRSEGLQVGIVKDGNITLTTVTPGHDFGSQIEVVSGLNANDQVIINPPDSIVTGQKVQIVQATLPGDAK